MKAINALNSFKTRHINKVNLKKIKKKLLGHNTTDGLLGKLFVYILLIGVSYVFLLPLIRMFTMSFMSPKDIIDPEVEWIPRTLYLQNYEWVEKVLKIYPRSLKEIGTLIKSLWFSSLLATSQTIISALTGFAFARFNFKFKNFWFIGVLVSFILPIPIVTIPRYIMIFQLQDTITVPLFGKPLFNSIYPQLMFSILGQGVNSAILILIFYNFFKMIPFSLDEAARIDGANSVQVFFHIYVRLVIPIITTVFLFSFVWNWNDTYTPQMFYNTIETLTMKLGVFDSDFTSRMGGSQGDENAKLNEAYKMAATFLTMLPLFFIYIAAQKQFIEGIERTGITGE